MSKKENGTATEVELSRDMQYVMDQITAPALNEAQGNAVPVLREEDRKALRRGVLLLNRALPSGDPEKPDFAKEMHKTYTVYAEIAAVHGRLRAAASSFEESKKTVKAEVGLAVRNELASAQAVNPTEKVTEKRIEELTDANPRIKSFLVDLGKYETVAEIAYGLRESLRMRFSMLEHRSNDERAQFKVGG